MFIDEDTHNYLDQQWLVVKYVYSTGDHIVLGAVYPDHQDTPLINSTTQKLVPYNERPQYPGKQVSTMPGVLKLVHQLIGEDPNETYDGYEYLLFTLDGRWVQDYRNYGRCAQE